jgi:hypothetical protein
VLQTENISKGELWQTVIKTTPLWLINMSYSNSWSGAETEIKVFKMAAKLKYKKNIDYHNVK